MKISDPKRIVTALAAAGLLMAPAVSSAGPVAPALETELQARAPHEEVSIIITLTDRIDPKLFKQRDKHARRAEMVLALKDKADRSQQQLRAMLEGRGARGLKQLWLINGLAFKVRADVARELANLPGIESIRPDYILEAPAVTLGSAGIPEWNLNMIGVPELWTLGYSGAGIVVASMDSGVDADHPDLAGKWRGGANSWFDPHGEHATPYDALGHGTQTMGILVGGNASGAAIGVAPDAQWIAVKIFDDAGQAQMSDIHQGFQWLLDPDGDPATPDTPDVVNASWGFPETVGQCVPEFNVDIQALKAAGIGIAFAAGNEGPAPLTSVSPANNQQGVSAGAIDASLVIASFSSRGQSACDGTIYPKLVAPGVNINTADLSFGGLPLYAAVSGTSYATPHAAGAMALLAGAFPGADIAQIEAALIQSANDLGVVGEDNSYGYGLADVQAAYQLLVAGNGTGSAPVITSTPPTSATEGSFYSYAVTATDADGDTLSFSLNVAPAGMTIDAATGAIAWTPGSDQAGTHGITVRVTDASGQAATQTFSVTVANLNQAPAASDNAYSMVAGTTLSVAAPGVLGNDSDADADGLTAVLASGTASGSLALNGNGSFSYTPNAGFAGTDSFTYRAFDGALQSNGATVSITVNPVVNKPPVAKNDSVAVAMRKTISYTPRRISVLANDSDPDGTLNPASVSIVVAPNKGGTVAVNADGTVSYTPKLKFRGKETFKYTVRDEAGAASNAATVTVSVR